MPRYFLLDASGSMSTVQCARALEVLRSRYQPGDRVIVFDHKAVLLEPDAPIDVDLYALSRNMVGIGGTDLQAAVDLMLTSANGLLVESILITDEFCPGVGDHSFREIYEVQP
jgi:Mg-chelatase subunit ChlD